MELGLRLGNDPPFGFPQKPPSSHGNVVVSRTGHDFCLAFSSVNQTHNQNDDVAPPFYPPPPLPLDLLPPRTPLAATGRCSPADVVSEGGGVVLKEVISGGTAEEGGVGGGESGRNPTRLSSSLEVEFGKYSNSRISEEESGGGGGGSDEEDQNSGSKKKLRLSREQSAFLEESFKEHHTLYPKQKVELARRLNLRPRQVEVWFQNRRARTKLKQTEVDCEYLKKCCETLTQQNRKLRKELQDLTALKTTHNSLFINSPPTTLTFCASCERAASTTNHTT